MSAIPTIPVLAQEPGFILINKPAGIDFHQSETRPGLVELVRQQTGLTSLHPVHRLDTLTSGLMLLARSPQAAQELGDALAEHRIAKFYLALSDKKPAKKQGRIAGGMEKGRNGSWRLVRAGGQPAVTQFFSYGLGNGLRLFVLRPQTGRTHQLRVALKSLSSPILGDERYGGTPADRGYLHAYALQFALQGQIYSYLCPPQSGLAFCDPVCTAALAALPAPWDLPWPRQGSEKSGNT